MRITNHKKWKSYNRGKKVEENGGQTFEENRESIKAIRKIKDKGRNVDHRIGGKNI